MKNTRLIEMLVLTTSLLLASSVQAGPFDLPLHSEKEAPAPKETSKQTVTDSSTPTEADEPLLIDGAVQPALQYPVRPEESAPTPLVSHGKETSTPTADKAPTGLDQYQDKDSATTTEGTLQWTDRTQEALPVQTVPSTSGTEKPADAQITQQAPVMIDTAVAVDTGLVNFLSRRVTGTVTRKDGSAVSSVTFYVQDLARNPPVTTMIYASRPDGSYEFTLGVGRWRVIPASPEFDFQPDHRDYLVGLAAGK